LEGTIYKPTTGTKLSNGGFGEYHLYLMTSNMGLLSSSGRENLLGARLGAGKKRLEYSSGNRDLAKSPRNKGNPGIPPRVLIGGA